MERRSRFCGVRVFGPFDAGAVLDQAVRSAQAGGANEELARAATAIAVSRAPRTWNESMPPNADIWRAAILWPGWLARPG